MAHDSAKREFEKQKVVHAKGGITLKEVDDAERAFVDTTYSYENGQISLDKLKVKAPFSGIIVDLPYYGPGMRVAAGEPVLRLMDYSSLFTDVTLPGKEMVRVKRGQKAVISNYSSSETLEGLVTQVSSALDPDSRMFKLRVEVGNSDSMLKPGMFARVDIVVSEKESTLVIPREIILERRGAKTVFIVQRGIAQERRLKTGLSNRDEIEVLEGLAKDDSLVIEGFETLRNRSRVKVLK